MKKTLLVAGAVALSLADCGSHSEPAKAKPTPSCELVDGECLPTAKTSYIGVPAAKVGQPIRYQVSGDDGAVNQEITVLRFKAAKLIAYPDEDYTAKPDAGHLYLCVNMRIRNVGTTAGDVFLNAQWFGLDGKTEEASLVGGAGCDAFGMGDDMNGQPNPQPGKYVTGSTLYQLPTGTGALEIKNRDGSPLFRVDYGSDSVKVPINEVGQ